MGNPISGSLGEKGRLMESKLPYRSIKMRIGSLSDVAFHFRVNKLETEVFFPEGTILRIPNWDIKGVTERYYIEEYIAVPMEEYLRSALGNTELVEYGIKAPEVLKYVQSKEEFFEEFLIQLTDNIPLE